MPPTLSMHNWVSLPSEVRNRIRTLFSIPRSRHTEVHDGVLATDGTTPEDFKALTIEKMQKYTGDTTEDFHKLLDLTIAKVNEELAPKPEVVEPVVEAPVVVKKNANAKKK